MLNYFHVIFVYVEFLACDRSTLYFEVINFKLKIHIKLVKDACKGGSAFAFFLLHRRYFFYFYWFLVFEGGYQTSNIDV